MYIDQHSALKQRWCNYCLGHGPDLSSYMYCLKMSLDYLTRSICLPVCMLACMPAYLYVCLSACLLSVWMHVDRLPVWPLACIFTCIYVCLYIWLNVCLPACLLVHMYVCLHARMFAYLSYYLHLSLLSRLSPSTQFFHCYL